MTDNPSPSDIRQEDVRELLPCPFCGNELYRSPRRHNPKAYCVNEDCYGKRMSVVNLDDPVCVAMWNTRAALSAQTGEPVAWRIRVREGSMTYNTYTERLPFEPLTNSGIAALGEPQPLYASPPPQPDTAPSPHLQCLRCGTVDAFGPVSKEKK